MGHVLYMSVLFSFLIFEYSLMWSSLTLNHFCVAKNDFSSSCLHFPSIGNIGIVSGFLVDSQTFRTFRECYKRGLQGLVVLDRSLN